MQNQMQAASGQQMRRGVTRDQWLGMITGKINEELSAHKQALPAGFNKARFTMNCATMVQDMMKKDAEKLKNIQPNTIAMCMVKGAYLGLDFFNGECYAIPYGKEMNFQTDYKGEIKLCKKYSTNPIKDIYAKLVREGDFFEESVEGGVQDIVFKPLPFSNADVIGAFAVVLFKDGSMLYEAMSADEIENIRNKFSKAKNSPAWTNTPGEMYKKTVLRRLCKLIDLNFDTIEARRAFEAAGDSAFEDGYEDAAESAASVDVFAEATEVESEPQNQPHTRPQIQPQQTAQKQVQKKSAPPVQKPAEVPAEAVQADFADFESQYSAENDDTAIDPNAGDLPF